VADLATVTRILADLVDHHRHLPNPPHLAPALHTAWNTPYRGDQIVPAAAMRAVAQASFTAGFTAGADRGHQLATTRIRDAVAEALAGDAPLGGDAHRFFHAAITAADHLTHTPNVIAAPFTDVELVAQLGGWRGEAHQLATAIRFGLASGWRAGHAAATQAVIEDFIAGVVDQLGREAVITTFLTPATPAYVWLDHVEDTIHGAAAADLTSPPPLSAPPRPAAVPAGRPARTGRAFIPLGRLVPPKAPGARPPAGPGRSPRRSR
jgi:hypothetical protein